MCEHPASGEIEDLLLFLLGQNAVVEEILYVVVVVEFFQKPLNLFYDFRVFNAAMAALQDRYGEWFLPSERGVPVGQIAADQQEYVLADTILVGSEAAAATIRTSLMVSS